MFFVKIKTCLLTAVQPGSPVLSSVWEGRRGRACPAHSAPQAARVRAPGSHVRFPARSPPIRGEQSHRQVRGVRTLPGRVTGPSPRPACLSSASCVAARAEVAGGRAPAPCILLPPQPSVPA